MLARTKYTYENNGVSNMNIQALVKHIIKERNYQLTIKEAAALCNVPKLLFLKSFKKEIGISFKNFNYRGNIIATMDELRQEETSICSIAKDFHYAHSR